MKKLLPQSKANATKDAKDIEIARNKQKKHVSQMDADIEKIERFLSVSICVHL